MTINITLGEILDKYDWDVFCDLKKYDVYILKDGRADSSEEVTLTMDEAKKIGIRNIFNEDD